jgi:hypothetical protein
MRVGIKGGFSISTEDLQLDNFIMEPFHIRLFTSSPFNYHMWNLFIYIIAIDANTYLNSKGQIKLNKKLDSIDVVSWVYWCNQ